MRQRFEGTDLFALNAGLEEDITRVIDAAVREETRTLKTEWRDQVVTAGLGNKLANTIRDRVYPGGARSADAAGWVWTKAPVIIDAYDRGPTIRPKNAGRLAIPTLNVPRRGRRTLTPVEVEALYDQDLTIRPGRRGVLLAFVDAQGGIAAWTRAQGKAYGAKGSAAQYKPRPKRRGRPVWRLMFILVKQTKVRKRLDLQALMNASLARYPSTLSRHWGSIPDRAAPVKRF